MNKIQMNYAKLQKELNNLIKKQVMNLISKIRLFQKLIAV